MVGGSVLLAVCASPIPSNTSSWTKKTRLPGHKWSLRGEFGEIWYMGTRRYGPTERPAIVGIWLHAQPDCVATAGFHNKVSTVPESPWPKLDVEQKFEIQIQNFNRFFCNRFWNDFFVQNVVRKQFQIWNLVLIFDPAQGYNFVAMQLFLFHDPIIFERSTRGTNESES